ncbi:hypothetical protein HDU96_000608 [Phlyctochytrium bullatum]|nr:hypothetical protein HDU96_000608 [Phlyctochytrium bullatum]
MTSHTIPVQDAAAKGRWVFIPDDTDPTPDAKDLHLDIDLSDSDSDVSSVSDIGSDIDVEEDNTGAPHFRPFFPSGFDAFLPPFSQFGPVRGPKPPTPGFLNGASFHFPGLHGHAFPAPPPPPRAPMAPPTPMQAPRAPPAPPAPPLPPSSFAVRGRYVWKNAGPHSTDHMQRHQARMARHQARMARHHARMQATHVRMQTQHLAAQSTHAAMQAASAGLSAHHRALMQAAKASGGEFRVEMADDGSVREVVVKIGDKAGGSFSAIHVPVPMDQLAADSTQAAMKAVSGLSAHHRELMEAAKASGGEFRVEMGDDGKVKQVVVTIGEKADSSSAPAPKQSTQAGLNAVSNLPPHYRALMEAAEASGGEFHVETADDGKVKQIVVKVGDNTDEVPPPPTDELEKESTQAAKQAASDLSAYNPILMEAAAASGGEFRVETTEDGSTQVVLKIGDKADSPAAQAAIAAAAAMAAEASGRALKAKKAAASAKGKAAGSKAKTVRGGPKLDWFFVPDEDADGEGRKGDGFERGTWYGVPAGEAVAAH